MWDVQPVRSGALGRPSLGVMASPLPLPLAPSRRRRATIIAERPASVVQARTEAEIAAAVLAARDSGLTVRAIGSGGSKNRCFQTSGVALRLEGYDRVLSVEGNRVEVQAGASVAALNEVLRRHDLAIPTQGEWLGATVAGAVATGVHGGSQAHGILATSIAAIRLITADGRVVTTTRGDGLFRHVAVSLGTLGVTSTVTFECLPAFHLELVSRVMTLETYLKEHDATNLANEFYSAIWIPTAGRVVTFAANRARPPTSIVPRRQRYSLTSLVVTALSRTLDVHTVSERWFSHRAVDWADRILTPIPGGSRCVRLLRRLTPSWREVELAIPIERAGEALAALDGLLAKHRHALRLPVGLRSSAADDFSLSPCAGRPTFWIALFFRDADGFAEDVRGLFERLGARSHWGKHVETTPAHLRRQYPEWAAFRATRQELDPDGLFTNAFSRRVGL